MNTKPNVNGCRCNGGDRIRLEKEFELGLMALECKAQRVEEAGLMMDFLAWLTRLLSEAHQVDPQAKTDIGHLALKTFDAMSPVFDVLAHHLDSLQADIKIVRDNLERTFNELKVHTRPQKPGPEEEEDINDGCGCED